jgi:hypothetical protein
MAALAIALVFPFYEPPIIAFVEKHDWATFTVSKPAMLIGSIIMMLIRIGAPIFLLWYRSGLDDMRQLRLAPPLPVEINTGVLRT